MVNLGKPNGILTFTTNGVTHLEIERRYGKALEDAYRKGLREGRDKALAEQHPHDRPGEKPKSEDHSL